MLKGTLRLTGNGDPFRPVAISVVVLHAMILFACYFQSFIINKPINQTNRQQKITIQTIELNTSSPSLNIQESKLAATVNDKNRLENKEREKESTRSIDKPNLSPIAENKPQPKVIPKPTPVKPKPAQKKTPAAKAKASPTKSTEQTKSIDKAKPVKSRPIPAKPSSLPPQTSASTSLQNNTVRQKLLAQARESLNKVQINKSAINSSKAQGNTSTALSTGPKTLGKLQSDAFVIGGNSSHQSREINYQDELLNRLKSQLHLVEYGDVDIELTLDRAGNVISVKILKDENHKNRQYIEKMIPILRFSGFGASFPGETQHTFVIRLKNE